MLVVGPKLGVALVVLTLVAAVVVTLGKLGHGRQVMVAAVRAAIQLGGVSLLIAGIVVSLWATAAFVVLMCAVAAGTSGRRVTGGARGWWAGVPIVVGSMAVATCPRHPTTAASGWARTSPAPCSSRRSGDWSRT
ncbi:ABC transporter permease [Micromonospora sp. NPDC000668]|uniref:ABC transporter permease n=1 Tax=Micromonospora sp. NPDC000668 TaxID=3364219 RepID=UPI0036891549